MKTWEENTMEKWYVKDATEKKIGNTFNTLKSSPTTHIDGSSVSYLSNA